MTGNLSDLIVKSILAIVVALFTKWYFFPYYIPGIPIKRANHWFFGFSYTLPSKKGKFDSHLRILDEVDKTGKIFQYYVLGYLKVFVSDKYLAKYFMEHINGKGHFHRGNPHINHQSIFNLDTGPEWKKRRSAFRQSFAMLALKTFQDQLKLLSSKMCDILKVSAKNKSVVEIDKIFGQLTIDVICSIAFQYDINAMSDCSEFDEVHESIRIMFEYGWIGVLPLAEIIYYLPIPYVQRYRHSKTTVKAFCARLFEHAKKLNNKGVLKKDSVGYALIEFSKMEGVTSADVNSEVETLFIAGHETTAHTLSFMIYALATHPDIQRKCQAAMDEQSTASESATAASTMSLLPAYVEAVLKESMRKYPVAARGGVRQVKDKGGVTIPLSVLNKFDPKLVDHNCSTVFTQDVTIPEGTWVQSFMYNVHNSKLNWGEKAEQFIPERFLPNYDYTGSVNPSSNGSVNPLSSPAIYGGGGSTTEDLSFFPFAYGIRNCIGMNLSLMEIRTVIADLLGQFTFSLVDASMADDHIAYESLFTSRPHKLLPVFVNLRNSSAPSKKPTAYPSTTRFPTAVPTTRKPSVSPTISQNPTTIYPTRLPTSESYAVVTKYSGSACGSSNQILMKTVYVTDVCDSYYDVSGNTSFSYNSLKASCANGIFTYTLYANNDCVDRGGSSSITYNTNTCLDDFLYSPAVAYKYIDDYAFSIECTSSKSDAFDTTDIEEYGALLTSNSYIFGSDLSCGDTDLFTASIEILNYCNAVTLNGSYVSGGRTYYYTTNYATKVQYAGTTLMSLFFSNTLSCAGTPYSVTNHTVASCYGSFAMYSFLAVSGWKSIEYSLSNTDFVGDPSALPSLKPTLRPTALPSIVPTVSPTQPPTCLPTITPTTRIPTRAPSTKNPTLTPTTRVPTADPTTLTPTWSMSPTESPTVLPTVVPSSSRPTTSPTELPTAGPTNVPTLRPTELPSIEPSIRPTITPTVTTIRPTLKPSVRPTKAPTTIYPTYAPSVAGYITRYQHTSPGCSSDSIVSITTYKTNVCLPYYTRRGTTSTIQGTQFSSKIYFCKDGMVFRVGFDRSDCVDDNGDMYRYNNTLSGCTVSPYNPEDGSNDDFDPYYYSYQCYATSEAAMSTVNMTGTLTTYREYSGFTGCVSGDMTYSFTGLLNYCYADRYNYTRYLGNNKYTELQTSLSWIYTLNHTTYYDDTAYCLSEKATAITVYNHTYGYCYDTFVEEADYYYNSDHTYELTTLSFGAPVGPTLVPTRAPTTPTRSPSRAPTAPTVVPTLSPSLRPTASPTRSPTIFPTIIPTVAPSLLPTVAPTTITPTVVPTSKQPTLAPTTDIPTLTFKPTAPTAAPTESPSLAPSVLPTTLPTVAPSVTPTALQSTTPSLRPSRSPSTQFPTNSPTTAGWISRYMHYGPGCSFESVMRISVYKSNVCLPDLNRMGSSTNRRGESYGSHMFECKNGMVIRHKYDSSDCVDLRNSESITNRNNSLGRCAESVYNPLDGVNDDFDPYYYSYQCYSSSVEAMSTVNMTGTLVTHREYVGSDGCHDSNMVYAFLGKLDYCYVDVYNDTQYDNGKYNTVTYYSSWIYTRNETIYYYGSADCTSDIDEIDMTNSTQGVCFGSFDDDIHSDYYDTSDHTYVLTTISEGTPTGVPVTAPTNKPVTNPSVSPSVTPTRSPSVIPTVVPSVIPSQLPSSMPLSPGQSAAPTTLKPSVSPTAGPSAIPSFAPTPQTAPVLSFSASTTLNGLTSPDLDKAAQDSIVNATASSMGIDSGYVNYTGCTSTLDGGRRLSEVAGIYLLTYSVVAHTDVVIPMAVFAASSGSNITDPTVLYATLTTALNDAMTSGAFIEFLTVASEVYGSEVTANVESTSVSVSAPTVMYPPTPQPTEAPVATSDSNSSSLSGGALVGVIVGPIVGFLILIFVLWYFCVRKEGIKKVKPASSSAGMEMAGTATAARSNAVAPQSPV